MSIQTLINSLTSTQNAPARATINICRVAIVTSCVNIHRKRFNKKSEPKKKKNFFFPYIERGVYSWRRVRALFKRTVELSTVAAMGSYESLHGSYARFCIITEVREREREKALFLSRCVCALNEGMRELGNVLHKVNLAS